MIVGGAFLFPKHLYTAGQMSSDRFVMSLYYVFLKIGILTLIVGHDLFRFRTQCNKRLFDMPIKPKNFSDAADEARDLPNARMEAVNVLRLRAMKINVEP